MGQVIETGGPKLYFTDVELTTGELLALFTTPKPLVAAQGASTVIEFESLLLAYDYNSIVYTIGTATNLQVKYTNSGGTALSTTRATAGFIDQASDQLSLLDKLEGAIAPTANAALVLTCGVADPTAGNSPIHLRVVYKVYQTGL